MSTLGSVGKMNVRPALRVDRHPERLSRWGDDARLQAHTEVRVSPLPGC